MKTLFTTSGFLVRQAVVVGALLALWYGCLAVREVTAPLGVGLRGQVVRPVDLGNLGFRVTPKALSRKE